MEESPAYAAGAVVWVKLTGGKWWPGEVVDKNSCPDEVTKGLRKEPLAIVKFFDEDYYETVKSDSNIQPFVCGRKDEFIKKGKELLKSDSHYDKFEKDVSEAKQKCGVIDDDTETLNNCDGGAYNHFGSGGKIRHTTYGSAMVTSIPQTKPLSSRSPSFSDYKTIEFESGTDVRIRTQTPFIVTPRNVTYSCDLCGFQTCRIANIIVHHKSHSDMLKYCNYGTDLTVKERSAFTDERPKGGKDYKSGMQKCKRKLNASEDGGKTKKESPSGDSAKGPKQTGDAQTLTPSKKRSRVTAEDQDGGSSATTKRRKKKEENADTIFDKIKKQSVKKMNKKRSRSNVLASLGITSSLKGLSKRKDGSDLSSDDEECLISRGVYDSKDEDGLDADVKSPVKNDQDFNNQTELSLSVPAAATDITDKDEVAVTKSHTEVAEAALEEPMDVDADVDKLEDVVADKLEDAVAAEDKPQVQVQNEPQSSIVTVIDHEDSAVSEKNESSTASVENQAITDEKMLKAAEELIADDKMVEDMMAEVRIVKKMIGDRKKGKKRRSARRKAAADVITVDEGSEADKQRKPAEVVEELVEEISPPSMADKVQKEANDEICIQSKKDTEPSIDVEKSADALDEHLPLKDSKITEVETQQSSEVVEEPEVVDVEKEQSSDAASEKVSQETCFPESAVAAATEEKDEADSPKEEAEVDLEVVVDDEIIDVTEVEEIHKEEKISEPPPCTVIPEIVTTEKLEGPILSEEVLDVEDDEKIEVDECSVDEMQAAGNDAKNANDKAEMQDEPADAVEEDVTMDDVKFEESVIQDGVIEIGISSIPDNEQQDAPKEDEPLPTSKFAQPESAPLSEPVVNEQPEVLENEVVVLPEEEVIEEESEVEITKHVVDTQDLASIPLPGECDVANIPLPSSPAPLHGQCVEIIPSVDQQPQVLEYTKLETLIQPVGMEEVYLEPAMDVPIVEGDEIIHIGNEQVIDTSMDVFCNEIVIESEDKDGQEDYEGICLVADDDKDGAGVRGRLAPGDVTKDPQGVSTFVGGGGGAAEINGDRVSKQIGQAR